MTRPRVLDLFCGAGGASYGYAQSGWDVYGVDHVPQPDYPFAFLQGDAMEVLASGLLDEFDLVHASPPCQVWTRARHLREAQGATTKAQDLLTPSLPIIVASGLPYVIENVPGAPLRCDVTLCGSMFGLRVRRHRWFQSNLPLHAPSPCDHKKQGRPVGVYHVLGDEIPHGGRTARTIEEARDAMGIGWMTWNELKEAIPPAYTWWLGGLAMDILDGA